MNIISLTFPVFFALLYLILYILNKTVKKDSLCVRISNWLIIFASFLFAGYANVWFAIILLAITFAAYFFAKKIKLWYIGVIVSVLSLCFFKYFNFFAGSLSGLFGNDYTALNIILPLGISFYTFSAISYIVDVKRGEVKAHSFADVALYIAFFPKLTSGPIQRSGDFFGQINKRKDLSAATFSPAVQIIIFGLFKKLVFADHLALFVDQVYEVPIAYGSFTLFLAVIAYSLQIYLDFSGYTDIAVGIAKMLGFDLPRNFNLPYLAHNVTEFWKRWHITLSEWLQKYIYIPLGGNRKGKLRTYFNLFATMVIGGLWHGANWTFVIWGALHGLALAIHKIWIKLTKSPEKKHSIIGNVVSIFLTFMFTSFCWIFFRAKSLDAAIAVITGIFSFRSGIEHPFLWLFEAIIAVLIATVTAIVKSAKNGEKIKKQNTSFVNGFYPVLNLAKFWNLVIFFIELGLIACVAYLVSSPFIYGNF